ncbi:TolC family protein [Candidatus Aerophobetes bacterium]|nr:TolC family protein [Candidatus Aerophobetes bacterium]
MKGAGKKFIVLVAVLTVFGAGASLALAAQVPESPEVISLTDAIKLAAAHSPHIKRAELELKEAELSLNEVRAEQYLQPSPVRLREAENSVKLAAIDLETARQDVAFSVEEAYYEIIRQQNLVKVNEEALLSVTTDLKTVESRFRAGVASRLDLLSVRNQVSSVEVTLQATKRDLENTLFAFSLLTGVEIGEIKLSYESYEDYTIPDVEINLDTSIKEALNNRVEVKKAKLNVNLRETDLELADPAYTPDIQIERIRIALEKARIDEGSVKEEIILEVRRLFNTLKKSEQLIEVNRQKCEQLKEALSVAEARFEAKIVTIGEVLDAKTNLIEGESSYINSIFDYNLNLTRFFNYIGQSFSEREEK